MWKSEKRFLKSTFAICPKDPLIDLGPLVIDLWRYLKTDLFNNWKERSVAPDNYKDIYFAYHSNSKFRPQPKHFKRLPHGQDLTPKHIACYFHNIIVELEMKK
jgi:hypothetical protein